MKQSKEENKESLKIVIITIALINAIFPVIFFWIVEISWEPVYGIIFTNGFFTSDPMKIYHLLMWIVTLSSWVVSTVLLYHVDKIVGLKE